MSVYDEAMALLRYGMAPPDPKREARVEYEERAIREVYDELVRRHEHPVLGIDPVDADYIRYKVEAAVDDYLFEK